MMRTSIALMSCCAVLALSSGSASAVTNTSLKVACPKGKIQAAIDSVAAGAIGTITVTGSCAENLFVPAGKTISIVSGSSTTRLVPAVKTMPVLVSRGDTTIQGMDIQNPDGVADTLVQGERGGYLQIVGSTLFAPKVEEVAAFWDHSGGRISNSRITGGATYGSAVEVWGGGMLSVEGNPGGIPGPDGAATTIKGTVESPAISCGMGSALRIVARKSATSAGAVLLKDSGAGIGADQCNVKIINRTDSPNNISITGHASAGLNVTGGTLVMKGARISGNNTGLNVMMTNATIQETVFANNARRGESGNADVIAGAKSLVFFNNWSGPSQLPDAFNSMTLMCWPDDSDAGSVRIDAGSVAPPNGKTLADLKEMNGCITGVSLTR